MPIIALRIIVINMKNTTTLDFKRHKLGLLKEASVFAVLDIYKSSGIKIKLELLGVITVLTHTERTYDEALKFIYKLEKVDNTESLISKLSKKELEAAVLIAKERQEIIEPKIEVTNNHFDDKTPVAKTPSFLKNYRSQLIIAGIFIAFVFTVIFLSQSSVEPIVTNTPKVTVEKPEKIIYLDDIQGNKFIKTFINNREAVFLLDTGASTTLISDDFLNELIKDNFVSHKKNYLGTKNFIMANGTLVKAQVWQLPSLTVGEIKLYNINVSVLKSINNSGFLLGMSTLKELGNYVIVPNENKILVKN
jgi:clan AA aspartic protease (TIGR02281 family)